MENGSYIPPVQPQPQYQPQPAPEHPKKGMCIAALVLGIVSVVTCWTVVISLPCGVVGLILGIMANKVQKNTMALTGMILSIVGLAITIIYIAIYGVAFLSLFGLANELSNYEYNF